MINGHSVFSRNDGTKVKVQIQTEKNQDVT